MGSECANTSPSKRQWRASLSAGGCRGYQVSFGEAAASATARRAREESPPRLSSGLRKRPTREGSAAMPALNSSKLIRPSLLTSMASKANARWAAASSASSPSDAAPAPARADSAMASSSRSRCPLPSASRTSKQSCRASSPPLRRVARPATTSRTSTEPLSSVSNSSHMRPSGRPPKPSDSITRSNWLRSAVSSDMRDREAFPAGAGAVPPAPAAVAADAPAAAPAAAASAALASLNARAMALMCASEKDVPPTRSLRAE
mmetsp:Transcript_20783/g.79695  ORF Transcript_20783/g.79695 Transcript_20783/m.79695 type:complete len:261 (+) Transcript_20783:42-824(+)